MAGYLLSKLNPRYLFQYIGQHIPIRGAESDASDGYESSIKAHEQLRSCAFRYLITLCWNFTLCDSYPAGRGGRGGRRKGRGR